MILSTGTKKESLRLITSKTLQFPSASGIEFYKNTLYIYGDNATHLLLLSTDYNTADSIFYWKSNRQMIAKKDKPDVESAMLLQRDNEIVIAGVGSMSDKNRWHVFEFLPDDLKINKTQFFAGEEIFTGIDQLNIEGSTQAGNTIVFCNRANEKSKKNHLLFWDGKDSVVIKEILLPETNMTAGMSGLYYINEKDLLLFTASEENTHNAKEDGEIGDSYLGWIHGFSEKMNRENLQPDGFLRLSFFDSAFAKQKIEALCAESVSGNRHLLHLVADNDDGKSKIFKIDLTL